MSSLSTTTALASAAAASGDEELSTFAWLFAWIMSLIMIWSPVLPYFPQYALIARTKNSEGFSSFVCLILSVANTLRVGFWIGKRFDTALLYQSLVMIVAQLVMLELVIRLKPKQLDRHRTLSLATLQEHGPFALLDDFWNWDDFASYVTFLGIFALVTMLVSALFARLLIVVEFIGALALAIEAMLGVPQWYRNYVKQTTAGLSLVLIGSWAFGDSFKFFYFLGTGAPSQFVLCAVTQIIVDFAILFQVYQTRYSGKKARESEE